MYTVAAYARMVADRGRMEAYAAALRAAVRPGAVVVDLGAGTGIMTLLACRFGARRVYAIEPADAIQTARETVAANGFSDRVVFLHDLSTRVHLPERADVIVSDLRGILPPLGGHLSAVADARERFLAPGGVLIPLRDRLRAAVVEAPAVWAAYAEPWGGNDLEFDLSPTRRRTVNTWGKEEIRPDHLLAGGRTWAEIDYRTVTGGAVHGEAEWTVERAGTGHGLGAWFDAELGEGAAFSTAPGEANPIYGRAFFPWPDAVPLAEGDRVRAEIRASPAGGDHVWTWATRVEAADGTERAAFHQSTLLGEPIAPERLRRRSHLHRPALGEDGRIARMVLEAMDGVTPVSEIARRVHAAFPHRFARWEDALAHTGGLVEELGA
jgi:protein arginine N-methyltransferase 1